MSFARGLKTGADIALAENRDDRAAAQQDLKNKIRGFDRTPEGYVPNARGAKMLEAQELARDQKMAVLQTQNEAIQSLLNAKSMTSATTYLALGDVDSAKVEINTNPILKEKLLETFGIVDISPIDMNHDMKHFEDSGLDVESVQSDPIASNALSSAFFKAHKVDGSSSMISVKELMAATGYHAYASKDDAEGITSRINRIGEILALHMKTPEELDTEATNRSIDNQNAHASKDVSDLKDTITSGILSSDLTDSEKLVKLNELNRTPLDKLKNLKAELDIARAGYKADKDKTEAYVARTTAKDEIALVAAKVKTEEMKGQSAKKQGGGLPTYAADFLDKLGEGKIEYNQDNLSKAYEIQGKKKLNSTKEKEISGLVSMSQGFHVLTKKFRDLDMDRNALSKIGTVFDKIMKPGLTYQDRMAALNTIAINSEIQAALAGYVKYMSGAAVTEGEYARYQDIFQAGTWSNKESAVTAMASFTSYLRDAANRNIETARSTPYDYMILKKNYEGWESENPRIDYISAANKVSKAKHDDKAKSIFDRYGRR